MSRGKRIFNPMVVNILSSWSRYCGWCDTHGVRCFRVPDLVMPDDPLWYVFRSVLEWPYDATPVCGSCLNEMWRAEKGKDGMVLTWPQN